MPSYSLADSDNDSANELQNLNQVLTRGKDAGGLQIQNLGTPVAGTDATTRTYVDNKIATAVATNYAFKVAYSFTNSAGSTFTDTPVSLTESFDDFNVVGANKFTAITSGIYQFTVTGTSTFTIPLRLKITSGSSTFYDIKHQQSYPIASTINYLDSNIYKLSAGDTVELVITSTNLGENVTGILFGYKP